MKATSNFKEIIQRHLADRAAQDPLFAPRLTNPAKSIDDCITYILNTVQKSGCNGFSDEEIFGMAAHYYDEEHLEVGKPISCKVVVNHSTELSYQEKEQAKEEARNRIVQEEMDRLRKKSSPKKPTPQPDVVQSSLF